MQFRQQQQPPHSQPRQPANAHTRASTCFSPYSQMLFANPSPFSHKKEGKTIKIRKHILIYIHTYTYIQYLLYSYELHTRLEAEASTADTQQLNWNRWKFRVERLCVTCMHELIVAIWGEHEFYSLLDISTDLSGFVLTYRHCDILLVHCASPYR